MPRQVRPTVPATRTVALTRGKAAVATTALARSATRSRIVEASLAASVTSWPGPRPAAAAAAAAAAPRPAMRQLRSRLVPIPAPDASDASSATATRVLGRRRRSRSATSSRASESTTCDGPASAGGRAEPKRQPPPVVPRTSARARMTLARSTSNWHGRDLRSATRTALADSNVPSASKSAPVKVPRKTQTNNTATEHDMQAAEVITLCCPECQEKVLLYDLACHKILKCMQYPCPLVCLDNCQWSGTLSGAVHHVVKNHRSVNCTTGPNAVITMKSWRKAAPIGWVTLQTCLGQNFLILIQKIYKNNHSVFLGTVRLFGHQTDADRFEYRMMLKTKGKIGRTFSYSTIVKALYDISTATGKGDCLVFDTSLAEIFSFEGNLEVEVSISVMKM